MRATPLFVVAALAGPAAAQEAPDPAVSVTETLLGERHGFNQDRRADNDDYWDVKNRLNLTIAGGPYTGALRIDTITYARPPDETYVNDYRFERVGFRADGELASVTAGDFYVLFGHGIVLSLRKIDELGLDTTLRGARLDLHLPGSWETTIVAGTTNIGNVDEVNRRLVEDPHDQIVGGRTATQIGDSVSLGLHAVATAPRESSTVEGEDRLGAAGADVGITDLPGGFAIHAEADAQWRRIGGVDPGLGERAHRPVALYGDVSWARGPITLTLELKDYYDFQPLQGSRDPLSGIAYAYSQPPSIERTDQQVPDNRNIYGGRLRADFTIPGTDHALFANYMQSRTRSRDLDEEGYVLEDVGAYHHGYGGGELRLGGGRIVLQGSGGYRLEREVESGDDLRRMWHAEADLTLPLFGPHGLHLSWVHQSWSQKNPVSTADRIEYDKGTAIAEWDYASSLAASFGFEYDDEVDQPGVRKLFQFGDVRFIASPNLTLRAVVGTQRGGLKCVNGVCRTFPPFAGARAEVIVRY